MRRILFRWRGFTVWSYPALLYVGMVAGVIAGNIAAHAARIDAFRTMIATYVLVVPALIGARLLFVISNSARYRRSLRLIWSRQEGGAAMYGALPLILVLSVPLLAILHLPLGAFWDVMAFSILAGMFFTRIGCLMNGCCAGRRSGTWLAVPLPNCEGMWERRIPSQCLEAGFAIVLLGAATVAWRWLPFPGALFLCVAAAYAGGRLVLESVREVEPGGGRLTSHHVISMAMILLTLATLAVRWPK
jgi:phosphatidylglycerol---prolipoprotein diacylglyceryl transferase